ncbi:MAG TPA: hypothetical protein VFR31_01810, partial [Thermoanaerobaculia bacterium]|nr:hypothetical protein [Thermoanaerobaculia bacterium]
ESKEGAKLTFFEVGADKQFVELSTITGASLSDLSNRISERLLTNDARKCAGQLTKELIQSYSNGQVKHASIRRPRTVSSAFEHALANYSGNYVRATFVLLC